MKVSIKNIACTAILLFFRAFLLKKASADCKIALLLLSVYSRIEMNLFSIPIIVMQAFNSLIFLYYQFQKSISARKYQLVAKRYRYCTSERRTFRYERVLAKRQ